METIKFEQKQYLQILGALALSKREGNDVINTIRTTLRKALREYPELKDNAEFKGYVHFANTSNIQTIFNN